MGKIIEWVSGKVVEWQDLPRMESTLHIRVENYLEDINIAGLLAL